MLSPSSRGWWITVMLFLLTTINCVDRLVLASVAPILQSTLHLSSTQYSYIVIAFLAGMMLGQLPCGIFIDRIGVRLGLPVILVGWSIVNVLHVGARQVAQFMGLRLAMGVFESGNYSGGLKAIGQTLPEQSRAVALGLFNSGFLLGSVLAPPIVVYTAEHFGWKSAFLLPGLIGMLWLIPWFAVYRSEPAARASNADPAPPALSLGTLLRMKQTWGVIAVRATSGPISQFYWYWLPLYLVRGRGASLAAMSRFAAFAYIIGGFGNVAGGYISGLLINAGMPADRSRKVTFVAGALLCAVCNASVTIPQSVFVADILAGAAIFGVNVMSCMLLAVMSDRFPQGSLARVGGLTGMGDGAVSMPLTLCAGIILDKFSFSAVFAGATILPLLSIAALYLLVKPLVSKETPLFVAG
jgi:ACS family hexuronate transporter-like MFS transporter